MSKLKPFEHAAIDIPEKIILNINGIEDIISYPIYGTVSEKTDYIRLVHSLSMVNQDSSIIV